VIFLLFVGGSLSVEDELYRGLWKNTLQIIDHASEGDNLDFDLRIRKITQNNVTGSLSYRYRSTKKIIYSPFYLCGMFFEENFGIILFGSWMNENIDHKWVNNFSVLSSKKRILNNTIQLYNEFVSLYYDPHSAYKCFILLLKLSPKNISTKVFEKNVVAEGIFVSSSFSENVECTLFNMELFIRQVMLYAIILALYIIISFYIWKKFFTIRSSNTIQSYISIHTLMCMLSYDCTLALSIPNIISFHESFRSVYWFLFFSFLGLFCFCQMIIMLHKTIRFIQSASPFDICLLILSIGMFLHCLLSPSFFKSTLFFVYTSMLWVPQIISNIVSGEIQVLGFCDSFIISFQRLMVSFYFLYYRDNHYELINRELFITILIIFVLEELLLFFQSKNGPSSVLPMVLRPVYFDYFSQLPNDEVQCPICFQVVTEIDYAITPCSHVIHLSCLLKWFNEKNECPICRSPLPPINNRNIELHVLEKVEI